MKLGSRQPSRTLAVLALLGAAVVANAADPPKPSRAIRVQGNQFVDAAGLPVVFRGMALSDPDKLERQGHWNRRIFEEMRAWGANIVRLPVHPAAWRARGPARYLALLDQGVGWAREAGLYVMIDWHVIGNLRTEKKGISWAAWCFDVDWVPTVIADWEFTPTEQGRLWKAAMLGQPLPAGE